MAQRREITNYNLSQNRTLNYEYYSSKTKTEKPISNVYNIYLNKEKMNKGLNKIPNCNSVSKGKKKVPLYNNPFYSPRKIQKRTNYKLLYPKRKEYKSMRNQGSIEYSSSYVASSKNELSTFQNHHTIHPDIYIKKKSVVYSPKRCLSQKNVNSVINNKLGSSYLTLTPSKVENYYNKENIKNNLKNNVNNNSQNNKNQNQNIININLYNEKNNYIENNFINKIYMNKNKNGKNITNDKAINTSFNNSIINNNESIINYTERKIIPRRTNYSFYYSNSNHSKKNNNIINRNQIKNVGTFQNNSKKKINYLPKVQRKISKRYDLSSIIKIQSIIRGYLLNKKLDKYLRHYAKLNNGIKLLEKKYKRNLFNNLKKIRQYKKYNISKNTFYNKKKYSTNNIKNEKNIELQYKINELINEKKELQNNYQNLKEFIRKYNELEKENQELKNEIIKLKQKNNELLFPSNKNRNFYTNYNFNKYKRYIIQKQNELSIISPKKFDLIYKKYTINKRYDNICEFFTLGNDGKDNEEIIQSEKKVSLKANKLRNLVKNKENKKKYILLKYFMRFYYKGICYQNIFYNPLLSNNIKSMSPISELIKKYNNESQNNLYNCMSIKTLSDNSSVFTERRGQNIDLDNRNLYSNNLIEEDYKRK